jgi:hypothetical protein
MVRMRIWRDRKADAREAYLSSLFGARIEEAKLAKRLSEPPFGESSYTAESLNDARSWDRQANKVSNWLHAMSGLVAQSRQGG